MLGANKDIKKLCNAIIIL